MRCLFSLSSSFSRLSNSIFNSSSRNKSMCHSLRNILAVLLLSFTAQFSLASQLNPSSTDIKVINGPSEDILVPVVAGSTQVSYSRFTSGFTIDRPLKILNTKDAHGNPNGNAAKIIIIQADYVDLNSSLEIIGETADILIVSNSYSGSGALQINCRTCSFNNAGRVTFAVATDVFSNSVPGIIHPQIQGYIGISNLSTANVASVEFIANHVFVGNINTQLKASYSSDGTYQLNPSGSVVVGAGGVNVFAGYNIDYSTLTLKTPLYSGELSIPSTSTITTQAVHISSAYSFTYSGSINTKSDVITIANYRGVVSAIDESIKLYALNSSSEINVNGTLTSDNLTDIQGSSAVNLNGSINTKKLNVASGAKLISRGRSDFFEAALAADIFENNGTLNGRSLKIAARGDLQNRFGGRLLADDIQLSSSLGVVRNGSQYPFKAQNDVALVLRADSPSNIRLGTINGLPYTTATKVSDLSAFILGKNITIVAGDNVENINPYFEATTDTKNWASALIFKPASISQVQMVADNSLNIGSNTYVLNSSAIMGVNNPGGEFNVSAPNVANERYNTKVAVQPFSSDVVVNNTTTTTTGTEAALLVFSPPGIIYSFSPLGFYFTSKTGGFINNTAYFEVLNNAVFTSSRSANEAETSKVTSIGLMLQQNIKDKTSITTMTTAECLNKYTNVITSAEGLSRFCSSNPMVTGYQDLAGTADETMQGTLFSVQGTISGANSEFYGTNHRTIDEMSNTQISALIAANTGQTGTFTKAFAGTTVGTYSYVQKAVLSADGKTVSVIQDGTLLSTTGTNNGDSRGNPTQTTTNVYKTYTVTDFLRDTFKALEDALLAMIKAFQDWLK